MLIKIESIRCPYVTGLMSGCLRNCRPDTPEYAQETDNAIRKKESNNDLKILSINKRRDKTET